MKIFVTIFFAVFGIVFGEYSTKDLRCLVCKTTVDEMVNKINSVNPNKKIQVGGYRIDENGKLEEKLVSYARSGMHLSELMDTVCKSMENYVRATNKTTGKLVLMKLVDSSGVMNPSISEVDIIQDSDLNKSLEFYCEGIVEEFEDDIYNVLKEVSNNPVDLICNQAANLCDNNKDEL